jgi:ubiquinone/menaquinone biosynthesis C-methylase UbiE
VRREIFGSAEAAAAWRRGAAQRARFLLPVTESMLDEARIGPGSQVLDIGTGTGDTALLAAERVGPTGRVIAIDASPEMLDVATEAAREAGLDNVEFRRMDGGRLTLEPASVDAVIGRHAMQFLDEWPAPLAGFHRVLRAGGRLSFIVWGSIAENQFMALPVAIPKELGWTAASAVATPFALSDRQRLRQQLSREGFDEVQVERVAFEARMPADAAVANRLDSPMSRAVINDLSAEQRTAFQREMRSAVDRMREGESVVVSGVSLLASATWP